MTNPILRVLRTIRRRHTPGTLAYCCEICDDPNPQWRIDRWGDAICSWSCDRHLGTVCHRLQRDWEITELSVRNCPKLRTSRTGGLT